jgi:CRP-like cAMP-binding protein
MTTDTVAAMRQCPFFEEFQPKHMEKLMTLGSEVHFEKDEIIFREDDAPGLFYIILSGRVALEATRQGRVYRVQTLYPRDEFGWTAMLSRQRQFQARALEPVNAMAFEVSQLREACRNNPYFGCAFLERLFTLVAEQLQSTRTRLVTALAEGEKETQVQ